MLCAASEVLQRHEDEFASRHVLFAGDLQDDYCLHMPAASAVCIPLTTLAS